MSLLTMVKVENFRSIRSLLVEDLEDYVPVIGLNSSGKSNLLRALNLFFNGVIDEDRESLVLQQDYSDYAPKGKKKTVSVTVGLSLADINVRGQADFAKANDIDDVIYIRKTWGLGIDKVSIAVTTEFGAAPEELKLAAQDDLASVDTYVRSIRFVYVPNHTRPSDLIKSELAPLSPRLVARLRASRAYKDAPMKEVFAELGKMGDRLFDGVSDALARGLPNTSVTPDLPKDFAELAFSFGVQTISDGANARSPEFEGSGSQSFLLLHTLDLADRTQRAGGFGWVQASIWAMEEPESFLHAGLRARFSGDLRTYADDPRRQVIVTTHQDEFVRVASNVVIASKTDEGTAVEVLPTREALDATTKRSITTFRHPLFTFPDVPLVLVEGRFDFVYLRAALAEAGLRPRWKLLSPDDVLGAGTAGDALHQYLKYNSAVISSRPDTAPLIVLRDWEAKDIGKYQTVLAAHPYSMGLTCPEELVNPRLDESWVGIERYLDLETVEAFVDAAFLGRETGEENARYTIKKSNLEKVKRSLADGVDVRETVGTHLLALATWLDDRVADRLSEIPASRFV